MNTIKLCGGLGNQLFQYAFGRVQKENGIDVEYDASWFNGKHSQVPLRVFTLDKFNIEVPLIEQRVYRKTIREDGYNPELLTKDGFNFHGYWQYPAYYETILPKLRKDLYVRKEFYTRGFLDLREEIIMNDNSIAVHIRRGDYLQVTGFPVLPIQYYKKALEIIQGDVYIFSDDIPWCKANFKGVRFIHLTDYFDFELGRLCRHDIISRSSFSWWFAHLNSNPSKIVVAPAQQLNCKVRKKEEFDSPNMFDPKNWIHAN